jgi:hypothetical protein
MRVAAAAVAVLLIAGCASQPRAPRSLSVQVFEARRRTTSTSVAGQHVFHVRVTNQSNEAVSIDAISVAPQSNVVQFHDSDHIIGETIESGQTADYQLWITVTAQPMNYVYTIDSVDVAVTCHSSSKGNFTESGSHTVGVE